MEATAIELEAQVLAREIADAMERILGSAESALRSQGTGDLAQHLNAILEACAIGDIANQRLLRIARLARGEAAAPNDLLHGPGGGVDQATADALMSFD